MVVSYECVIELCDGRWVASFPQVDGLEVWGHTREEAVEAAAEALKGAACRSVNEGGVLPQPMHVAEVAVVSVQVTSDDVALSRCMSMADAARILGVGQPRISRLVSKGVLEVIEAGGRRAVTIASVERYASERRGPGRPRGTRNKVRESS